MVIQTEAVPLHVDEYGDIRVGNSRVLLELVIDSFNQGVGPEGIVHQYPSLRLADVFGALAYYLNHHEEIQKYLQQREEDAEYVRRKIEEMQPSRPDMKEKLLARRAQMETNHAPSPKPSKLFC